jgi:hypothetical protein
MSDTTHVDQHEYATFFKVEVDAEEDGVWTTGKVQYLFQDIQSYMTHTVPTHSILPNISQSFSIVWVDNSDSICDLHRLLTYVDPSVLPSGQGHIMGFFFFDNQTYIKKC